MEKPKFLAKYVALLWEIMSLTGKGYKQHSLRHTGEGDDRRKDKLKEVYSTNEDGSTRIDHEPFMCPESKIQRAARLQTIGRKNLGLVGNRI